MSFRFRVTRNSPHAIPGCANRGVWWVDDLKWAFPFPPMPPSATFTMEPSSMRSAMTSPVSGSSTWVPGGTLMIRSSPSAPVTVAPHAVAAVLGAVEPVLEKMGEVVEVAVRLDIDIPPLAAVPAVGPPLGHILLPQEGDGAGPAVSGLDPDGDGIGEFRHNQLDKAHGSTRMITDSDPLEFK